MPIGAVWATPSLVHVVMMVSWIIIWVFAFGGRQFCGLLVLAVVFVFRSACVFAGIRVTVFAVQASPLCGAAPTFLCRRKEK